MDQYSKLELSDSRAHVFEHSSQLVPQTCQEHKTRASQVTTHLVINTQSLGHETRDVRQHQEWPFDLLSSGQLRHPVLQSHSALDTLQPLPQCLVIVIFVLPSQPGCELLKGKTYSYSSLHSRASLNRCSSTCLLINPNSV